jgi:hypothetical protein
MTNFEIQDTFSVEDINNGLKIARAIFDSDIIVPKPQNEAELLQKYKELKVLS